MSNVKMYYDDHAKPDSLVKHLTLNQEELQDNREKIGGSQPKNIIVRDSVIQYVKFDNIERYPNSSEVAMNYSYPSIVEAVSSALIRNSNIESRVRCTDYYFAIITNQDTGGTLTGSISNSFRRNGEIEYKLVDKQKSVDDEPLRKHQYAEQIVGKYISPEFILKNMAGRTHVPYTSLTDQFDAKSALDKLLDNQDVLFNPGNFIVVRNVLMRESFIVSMDYGRCIAFADYPQGGYYTLYRNAADFEPFIIDLEGFESEVEKIASEVIHYDIDLGKYTISVGRQLLRSLNNNTIFWRDVKDVEGS